MYDVLEHVCILMWRCLSAAWSAAFRGVAYCCEFARRVIQPACRQAERVVVLTWCHGARVWARCKGVVVAATRRFAVLASHGLGAARTALAAGCRGAAFAGVWCRRAAVPAGQAVRRAVVLGSGWLHKAGARACGGARRLCGAALRALCAAGGLALAASWQIRGALARGCVGLRSGALFFCRAAAKTALYTAAYSCEWTRRVILPACRLAWRVVACCCLAVQKACCTVFEVVTARIAFLSACMKQAFSVGTSRMRALAVQIISIVKRAGEFVRRTTSLAMASAKHAVLYAGVFILEWARRVCLPACEAALSILRVFGARLKAFAVGILRTAKALAGGAMAVVSMAGAWVKARVLAVKVWVSNVTAEARAFATRFKIAVKAAVKTVAIAVKAMFLGVKKLLGSWVIAAKTQFRAFKGAVKDLAIAAKAPLHDLAAAMKAWSIAVQAHFIPLIQAMKAWTLSAKTQAFAITDIARSWAHATKAQFSLIRHDVKICLGEAWAEFRSTAGAFKTEACSMFAATKALLKELHSTVTAKPPRSEAVSLHAESDGCTVLAAQPADHGDMSAHDQEFAETEDAAWIAFASTSVAPPLSPRLRVARAATSMAHG